MGTVRVRFTGGPADGTVADLPAGPDGAPPVRWTLTLSDHPHRTGPTDHLYQRQPGPAVDGGWTMRWVRADPVGMTE